MAYADDSRYTMVNKHGDSNYVWILDTEKGKLKYCWKLQFATDSNIFCSKWKDVED